MSSRLSKIDTGVGVSFIVSAVIHLAVFLLLVWWGRQFPAHMAIQETYYVDVVNLPVANPQAGSSAQKPGETGAAPPPAPAPAMTVPKPLKAAPKAIVKPVKPAAPQESAETESAFDERMAKLEGKAEAQQYEEKMKRLSSRTKAGSNTKVGTPAAVGTEAGSNYADFIKSRLEDALKMTSFYTTKKPEVAVRLTIAADGKLLRMTIERSSGDAAFEKSVRRAIDLASEKFTAPPNRVVFENGFLFKPKGISNDTSR
jgi:colicin import membrane protein